MQANPESEHICQFPLIRVRRLLQSLMDFVLETKASFWDISLVLLKISSLLVILMQLNKDSFIVLT